MDVEGGRLKRRWEEEVDDLGRRDVLSENQNLLSKKPKLMPIRTTTMRFATSTMMPTHAGLGQRDTSESTCMTLSLTPAESDEDSDGGCINSRPSLDPSTCLKLEARDHSRSGIGESDMSDVPLFSPNSNLHSPFMLKAPDTLSDRVPTPMFGSFPHHLSSRRSNGHHTIDEEPAYVADQSWSSRPSYRPLPSPISENEDVFGSMNTVVSGEMIGRLDVDSAGEGLEGSGSDMELEDGRDCQSQQPSAPCSSPVEGFAGSMPKPPAADCIDVTMKEKQGKRPMLSMGYRADCEKCRARVPGHYSHFLR